ncbi:methyltransferase [Psychromonas sp. 14N.309.X.WAT.B.A12]|uniref:methyltransferase n=1 Tax=unclassified Psychromonas TaxID=2614957 RepID=UPI0025AF3A8A|nr:methyltransferase [Psychromonas sp. 14N.309.X.WAT.B.A12]MDN2664477.1 methyltransferase [Psychromonas sp. 14N.309.X.WAT.B.A12]
MLSDRFDKIDKYLAQLKGYWHYSAFSLDGYPAFNDNNELIDFLESINQEELLLYQNNPGLLHPFLKAFIPDLLDINDPLFQVEDITTKLLSSNIPFWFQKGIKGRKWTQIDQFSEHIDDQLPVLEWCAGKGHLGRLIHYKQHSSISAVEWNIDLCIQGRDIAKQYAIPQTFHHANVLLGEADSLLKPAQHVVALHACGDLHSHLINVAGQCGTAKLTISPCCYHLMEDQYYQAHSHHALHTSHLLSEVKLSKQDLKLAVSQQSTSGSRQTQLNDQEVWWRLSFDCLQKTMGNTQQYMNVPSFPKTLLSQNFAEFVKWVMLCKNLSFHLPEDLSGFLIQGRERFEKLRRGELVSQYFRRPLELWLVYDRALRLQELGYQVQVSTFCQAQVTPRNLLIQASR